VRFPLVAFQSRYLRIRRLRLTGSELGVAVSAAYRAQGKAWSEGDLLKINGGRFFQFKAKLSQNMLRPAGKVLVVGNPCNTNAFIAKSVL